MIPCGDCEERAFATDRALGTHRIVVHQDEASRQRHIYRPEVTGDLTSPCVYCGMPLGARRHDLKPNRPPSWER